MTKYVSTAPMNGVVAHATPADAVIGNIRPGDYFAILATGAGNVPAVLQNGTIATIYVAANSYTIWPFAVVRVNSTNLTATATYANLYSDAI